MRERQTSVSSRVPSTIRSSSAKRWRATNSSSWWHPTIPGPALEALEPGLLAESEWVLREPGSGTRSVFEAAVATLAPACAKLRVAMELPSNEAVRAAVEAGLGATAISASVAAPSLEVGLLTHVALALPERDFTAIRHSERSRSGAVEALLALMAA